MRVGVDTGGTFTDLVAASGKVVKVPSTPHDPAASVRRAIELVGTPVTSLHHGTTVATNALLERELATVALVTNAGFADVIEIARQARPSLYDAAIVRPEPLVPRELRFEIHGRLGPDGRELEPVVLGELDAIGARVREHAVEVVAVCLLHSDLNADHEIAVASHLRSRGVATVCSHEVSPEYREYERTVTTTIDAALRPGCSRYLERLRDAAPDVAVMTSSAGLVSLDAAAARPSALLLSGPAGGLIAAAALAGECGFANAVTLDMGGTSTDVGLVIDGQPEPAGERRVAGYPVRMPSLAIHTIGAGGGSIAAIDSGGALTVGPRSAGAVPGPAAYGRGGTAATVTDADVVLGRIDPDATFAGIGPLDRAAADAALRGAGVAADEVVAVVDAAMTRAVRLMTVERGIDPRSLALIAFGGAGALHACAIAEALDIGAVVVPPRAGVFSAVGLLGAARSEDVVGSVGAALDATIARVTDEAQRRAGRDGAVRLGFDCRYRGQSHELTVADPDDFVAEHRRRNGFALDADVEVVAVRARAMREPDHDPAGVLRSLPIPARADQRGPGVVTEGDHSLWVASGWAARVGPLGAWMVERS